jgi:hypothetical protein
MNNIQKVGAIMVLMVLSATVVWAQGAEDYAFEHEGFSEMKALFWEKSTTFRLLHGKRTLEVPIGSSGSIDYLVSLAGDKKLKLTAKEAFFIGQALPAWEVAKVKIGFDFAENGLGIKILSMGSGEKPQNGQTVVVHYTGTLEDGTEFDSSVRRGTPFEFPLGQGRVIKGWDLGIAELPVGTRAILWIPADLGYGSRGAGGVIKPGATLLFEVELLGVK